MLLLLWVPCELTLTSSPHSAAAPSLVHGEPTTVASSWSYHEAPSSSSSLTLKESLLLLLLNLLTWILLVRVEISLSLRWCLLPLPHPLSPTWILKEGIETLKLLLDTLYLNQGVAIKGYIVYISTNNTTNLLRRSIAAAMSIVPLLRLLPNMK